LFTESVLLAEQSGNDGLMVSALGNLSGVDGVLQPGRGSRDAVRMSLRATELVRRESSARRNAICAAGEAVTYALVGDESEFERAVVRMWREADHGLDDSDSPIQLEYVTESELCAREATGRMLLGHNSKAVELYRRSLTGSTRLLPRDEAGYRAYLAATFATLGDKESAIAEGLAALSILEEPVSSPRLVARLQPVRAVVADWRNDDADQFRSRFDTFVSAQI
jgi:hypothetical protein